MTQPLHRSPSGVDPASLAALAAQLLELAGELEPLSTPPTALGRLLKGSHAPEDVLRLAVAVAGCRLLLVDVQRSDAVLGELRALKTPHAWLTGELAVLVPSRRAATALATRLARVAPGARVGVSSELRGPEELVAGLREARRVTQLADQRISFADEQWAALAIAEIRQHVPESLPLDNPLRRLSELRPEFLDTLRCWLRHNGDTAAVARELCVHPNTLRYRLRRLQEITGCELDDPRVHLLAWLLLT